MEVALQHATVFKEAFHFFFENPPFGVWQAEYQDHHCSYACSSAIRGVSLLSISVSNSLLHEL